MSKPPGKVDALLLQIRTMKWQAVTVLSSSPNGLVREDAAAVVAALDSIACALGGNPAPDVVKAAEQRMEAIARQRDHPPLLRRSAGRS